ncbi:MAG: DeoR/GlpR family DNA-binding transcription regulator [Mycoplasmatales bacterium]
MNKLNLINIIEEKNILNIKELLSLELTSESTLRRRLKELKEDGFLDLKYGGYIELTGNEKISISDEFKTNVNRGQKRRLGKMCADLISDGDIIFIDNGTTVRYILEYIGHKNVEVYTNGYNHIDVAKKKKINLNIIPGNILYREASIVGEEAISYLADINFDCSFIGANGFDEIKGVTTPNISEANLKKFMLKHAEKSYVVIDSRKYKLSSKYKICNFDEFPIITLPIT